jgi:flagellum-specific peptidoglycan hydrolase FlgJ
MFDKLRDSITGAFDGIKKSGGEIYDNMKESITGVYDGLKDFGNIAYDKMEESVNSISNNVTKAKDDVLSLIKSNKAEESIPTPPSVPETEPPKTQTPTEPPKRPQTAREKRAANRERNDTTVKGIETETSSTKPEIFNPNNESSSTVATDASEPDKLATTSPFKNNPSFSQTSAGAVTGMTKPSTNVTPGSLKDKATAQPFEGSQKEFYDKMYSTLLDEAKKQGVENPEVIARLGTAQSAIETGYGKHLANGNNYFGIKARPGDEGSGDVMTTEYINGQFVKMNQKFRKYNNMEESAADYVKFLKENGRYKKVLASTTIEEAIDAIGKSGYAGDNPLYAPAVRDMHKRGVADTLPNAAPKSTQSTSPSKVGNVSTEFPTWSESMQSYGEMKKVEGAVIHHTGGASMSGAIETLKQRGLSYHYIIDKDGTVKQLIPGKGIGYHAESYNANTFGIALVAEDDSKVTPEQVAATTSLNAKLAATYDYDPKKVFGHGEISKNKMPSEGKTVVDSIRAGLAPTVTGAVKDVPGVPVATGLRGQQRAAAAAPQQPYASQQNNNQNNPQTAAVYNRNVAQILLGSLINSSGYG